jgi:hypothetical protein
MPKLDKVFRCNACGIVFLFADDVLTHKSETGHFKIDYASLVDVGQ